ncbi:MAG: choice-of-anchor tandem repeat GloVer-containing protein [Cyclobacteriaceae bacterium]
MTLSKIHRVLIELKSTLLLVVFLCVQNFALAQENKIIGVGEQDGGSIFSITKDGVAEKLIDFYQPENPSLGEIIKVNGKLWGAVSDGGANSGGILFSINEDGTDYEIIHEFELATGSTAYNTLIEDGGKIWGTTRFGGDDNGGVIYNLNADGSGYQVLHHFDVVNGKRPNGLIKYGAKFFGMTSSGGLNDGGIIFSINADGSGFHKIHDFESLTGVTPFGQLLVSNGKFWGMTSWGGSDNWGVIFSIDFDGSGFTVHHNFRFVPFVTGLNPVGSLIEVNEKLWGVTQQGGAGSGGTIFNLNTDGTGLEFVYSFVQGTGIQPWGDLTEVDGKLWGTTTSTSGVIFNIDLDGSNYMVSHSFGTDAPSSYSTLVQFDDKLYGTTVAGGDTGAGTLFSFDFAESKFTQIHDFTNGLDCAYPRKGITAIGDKLWGISAKGGNGVGIIYNLNADGSAFTIVSEGLKFTNGGLLEYDGKLWGTASSGGYNETDGTIFSVSLSTFDFQIEKDFAAYIGGDLRSDLIEANGLLWGHTAVGGDNGKGTIFSFDPGSSELITVHHFNETDGRFPAANMILVDGRLIGNASGGEFSRGVIFSFDILTNVFEKTYDFVELDGYASERLGSLVESFGKLWGLSRLGGVNNKGFVFTTSLDGTNFTIVYEFNEENGKPEGSLLAWNGKLWGMADLPAEGSVFTVDPKTMEYSRVLDLSLEIGGEPVSRSMFSLLEANERPSEIALSNTEIEERNELQEEIGSIITSDNNSDDTHTYELSGADAANFAIDDAVLKATSVFDYKTKSSYSITITSYDQDGLGLSEDFEIAIQEKPLVADDNLPLSAIYPNPSAGRFKIEFGELFELVDLRLLSISGKEVVFKYEVIGEEMWVDCKGLIEGLYILRIETANQTIVEQLRIEY